MIRTPSDDPLDDLERAESTTPPTRQSPRRDSSSGRTTMKAAPRKAPRMRGEAADDDDEQDLERAVEVEAVRLDRAQVGEGPEHAGDADDRRS